MRDWLIFIFLGCVAWGTSFLWIKIALEELGPLNLVAWRMLFGAATIWVVVKLSGIRVERRGRGFWLPPLLGIIGTAAPIALISWAETRIDSGLAGILNATMPIWTMLIAHFVLHDDRFSAAKIFGMLLGFAGLFILLHPDVGVARDLMGQLAVVAAAILYAISTVSIRKYLAPYHSIQNTAWMLTGSAIFATLLAVIFEDGLVVPAQGMTWLASAWMGILGMGLAAAAFLYLIHKWGATKTSMVTYLFPIAALILGTIFLDEKITWEIILGTILIIGGIALVNLKWKLKPSGG